jgi:hypothetical protein
MKINSIFLFFMGLFSILLFPRTRQWLWINLVNQQVLRRLAIRVGMSIPAIRRRMLERYYQGVA